MEPQLQAFCQKNLELPEFFREAERKKERERVRKIMRNRQTETERKKERERVRKIKRYRQTEREKERE